MNSTSSKYFIIGVTLQDNILIDRYVYGNEQEDIHQLIDYVQGLERSKVDFVVVNDAPLDGNLYAKSSYEAVTLTSWLASKTETIALVPILNSNYIQPFTIARWISSLDHTSRGRIGWSIDNHECPDSAANFSTIPSTQQRRDQRLVESITVIRQLFDSWQDEAVVRDKPSGEFIAVDKVHSINYQSEIFNVKGPLNTVRSPQGQPPLFVFVTPQNMNNFLDIKATRIVIGLSDEQITWLRKADSIRFTHPPKIIRKIIFSPVVDENNAKEPLIEDNVIFHGTFAQWQALLSEWQYAGKIEGVLISLFSRENIEKAIPQRHVLFKDNSNAPYLLDILGQIRKPSQFAKERQV